MSELGLLFETKQVLRSLIISCPQNISVQQLNNDFRSSEGKNIPYGQLGYPNLESFLRSIPDTLFVECNGYVRAVVSSKTEHIDNLVSKQKKTSRSRINYKNPPRRQLIIPPRPPPMNFNRQMPTNQFHSMFQHAMNSQTSLLPTPPPYNYQNNSQYNMAANYHHPTFNHNFFTNTFNMQNQLPLHSPDYYNRNIFHHPLFNNNSFRTNNSNFLHNKNGYNNGHPGNDLNNRNSNTQNNYSPRIINKSNEIPLSSYTQNNTQNEPEKQNSFNKTNNNIEVEKENNYEKQNGTATETNLDTQILKLNLSMEKLTIETDDDFDNSETNESPSTNSFNDALPCLKDDDIIFRMDIPKATLSFGTKIEKSVIPKHINVSSQFQIFVTEIHNPYRFWFHFAERAEIIDSLMHDIELYYVPLAPKEHLLPESLIKKGQVCAAYYLKCWHRGEIVRDLNGETAKVFFVDYGTTAEVNKMHIKFLWNKFADIPSQVFRGSLGYIKPNNSHRWSRESSFCFLSLVVELILYAKATEIDEENQIVTMLVIDTNNQYDIHINETLVDRGFACVNPPPENVISEKDSEKRKKIFSEIYPTFEMLEYGDYPSFSDIGILLSKGINYYEQEDENCIPDIDYTIKPLIHVHKTTKSNDNSANFCNNQFVEKNTSIELKNLNLENEMNITRMNSTNIFNNNNPFYDSNNEKLNNTNNNSKDFTEFINNKIYEYKIKSNYASEPSMESNLNPTVAAWFPRG